MSENYPSDVKLNENQNGTVSFATEVVATIAGLAATEVDGVASMSSQSSGFADMFSRKNNRNFTKGVRIDLDSEKVTVDITMVVEYGSPVPDVARNIQENVKKAIETMTGLDVRSVDVHVSGISFEREQRAIAELDEQQRKMLEKSEAPKAEEPAPEAPAAPARPEQPAEAPVAEETGAEDDAAEEDDVFEEEDLPDEDDDEDEEAPEDEEVDDDVIEDEVAEDEEAFEDEDTYEDDEDDEDEIIQVAMDDDEPEEEPEDAEDREA